MENGVRGRAQTAGGGELASRRNKKARDFTNPFFHKSTLLSTIIVNECFQQFSDYLFIMKESILLKIIMTHNLKYLGIKPALKSTLSKLSQSL